ncbi:MAG TPA: cobyrinic acid a,c-diamide synthase, partial [Rhizobiales bacterium]|nr:cobyrinic acid a,c-diamide synthase [Hyphomicrobiales bacterium]
SFARRSLHLGYRKLTAVGGFAGLAKGARLRAHEFHYACVLREAGDEPLFEIEGAGKTGLRRANVAGSFMHLIDIDEV